jgi:hypothetical protein
MAYCLKLINMRTKMHFRHACYKIGTFGGAPHGEDPTECDLLHLNIQLVGLFGPMYWLLGQPAAMLLKVRMIKYTYV